MTSGCRFSLRHIDDAEHAGIGELEAEHHLAGVFGLALDRKRHFELVFREIVRGNVDLDVDGRLLLLAAPGRRGVRFSNDRSLVYCASTLSWGGACSGGAPLPLVMKLSPEAGERSPVFV